MLSAQDSSGEASITTYRVRPLGPPSEAERRHPLLCAALAGAVLTTALAGFPVDAANARLMEVSHAAATFAAVQVLARQSSSKAL